MKPWPNTCTAWPSVLTVSSDRAIPASPWSSPIDAAPNQWHHLWRGSLLPLGCAAPPKRGTAAQSSGSKLPRHSYGNA
ncbi:hypothetical protein C1X65_18510 [Pseudomonas sp. FW305-70]|nr:hypothetical protein C1X65_18510 [Pseudomonas sp. FW305-70]